MNLSDDWQVWICKEYSPATAKLAEEILAENEGLSRMSVLEAVAEAESRLVDMHSDEASLQIACHFVEIIDGDE